MASQPNSVNPVRLPLPKGIEYRVYVGRTMVQKFDDINEARAFAALLEVKYPNRVHTVHWID